jgi:hypothetical protein
MEMRMETFLTHGAPRRLRHHWQTRVELQSEGGRARLSLLPVAAGKRFLLADRARGLNGRAGCSIRRRRQAPPSRETIRRPHPNATAYADLHARSGPDPDQPVDLDLTPITGSIGT